MNLLSLRAMWKAIRGRSLLFAVIFSMAVFGLSFAGILRESLRLFDLWLPVVWLIPLLLIGWLAKKEEKLPIEETLRSRLSIGLVIISITGAILLWRYEAYLENKYPEPVLLFEEDNEREMRKGPRGKR